MANRSAQIPLMKSEPATPLMRQYTSIKSKFPHALLFFRLGDFYEMFFEDAVVAARELQITLTSRNKEKGVAVPMCGVPHHAADHYVAKLIQKGYKVAICEQVESPRQQPQQASKEGKEAPKEASKQAKKLVHREVTRVVTPGTAMDTNLVSPGENNFLAAVCNSRDRLGLACLDLSTGEFRATEWTGPDREAQCVEELRHLQAREVLFPTSQGLLTAPAGQLAFVEDDSAELRLMRTPIDDWAFDPDYASQRLLDHFHVQSLDGFGMQYRAQAVCAAGALIHYLQDTQQGSLAHLDRISFYERHQWMILDSVTTRNLELMEPLFSGSGEATLIWVLDRTATGMGGRLLRSWILRPSLDRGLIEARLDGVQELAGDAMASAGILKHLESVYDLERLLSKVIMGTATPRDLAALRNSLVPLPSLKTLVGGKSAPLWKELHQQLDELSDLRALLQEALAESPPINIADGGVIRDGYHGELDELRALSHSGKQTIAQMEARERQSTGIQSLKIKFNNIFGYYIEVSKANLASVPDRYERKQTLVSAERYTTAELKDYERKVLDADERMQTLEQELFGKLRAAVAAQAPRVRTTAAVIAAIDVLANFASLATEYDYCRPTFTEDGTLEIGAGRHPVLERLGYLRQGERFVPNDLYMNADSDRILIITGPNMGGKSTYLRQVALMSILAQTGCFVPATSARLPLFDRIFTRIGASDSLARGRSTFMVEMTETAVILNTATPSSLIILDEIGRGTATFDGLAIAWAVVEFLHERAGVKALFATHYHELTELAEQLAAVENRHVSVKESDAGIVFLRRVERGSADRSYGIEVARLAGLPAGVIGRARDVLAQHEQSEHRLTSVLSHSADEGGDFQLTLFTPAQHAVAERLAEINLDELSPLDALNLLAEIKKQLQQEKPRPGRSSLDFPG